AWTYGEEQHRAAKGPAVLAPGASAAVDGGPPQIANACSRDASVVCSKIVLPSAEIMTMGAAVGSDVVFGSAPYQWHSFSYAASPQAPPTAALTPDGNGIQITGAFVPPLTGGNWEGVGFYFNNSSCIDATRYKGLKFDFSGDLGACSLGFGAN